MQPEHPNEILGVRNYSRVKFHKKQDYMPSMTGSKYIVTRDQLEYHGALHMDVHMLFMKSQEEQPYTMTVIMIKLSLKAGLKEWGTKSHNAVHSKMRQLHFRHTFKPIH